MATRIKNARPAAVVVGAVSLGMVGMAVTGGVPVAVAVACVVLFWLV